MSDTTMGINTPMRDSQISDTGRNTECMCLGCVKSFKGSYKLSCDILSDIFQKNRKIISLSGGDINFFCPVSTATKECVHTHTSINTNSLYISQIDVYFQCTC